MKDISLHILDIVMNSLKAGATDVSVSIEENASDGMFRFAVKDNGRGMNSRSIKAAMSASYEQNEKNSGLGIPLLLKAVQDAGGSLNITSEKSSGTLVEAVMKLACITPGDIGSTIAALIVCFPDVRFRFSSLRNNRSFDLDTDSFKHMHGITQSELYKQLRCLQQGMNELQVE
ncbi:MAG: ATP-binding protein [Dissulfurispiraceae bacterium]|jgi:signal transduction histidine kinase|nr:ATP-binding protein [Dissulfurispiraceae bacterium]